MKRIGETPYKSRFTIRSQVRKRGPLCIGTEFFRRLRHGLTAYLLSSNALSLRDLLLHINSMQIFTVLPGITRITLRSMLVSHVLQGYIRQKLTTRIGGLLGPMIIHGPSNARYDIDLGPVFLTDYYHREYFEIVKSVVEPLADGGNPKPSSDNNLINGKMNFDCSTVAAGDTTPCSNNAGISKFKFTTGKTHRLRLINAGAEGIQRFSIDGHNMTVIANDFVPIVGGVILPKSAFLLTPSRNHIPPT